MMRTKEIMVIMILGITLLLSGCAGTDLDPAHDLSVERGDIVTLDYTLMHENGTVIETSDVSTAKDSEIDQISEPITFEAGSGQMLIGIDEGILGMSEGEQRSLTLPPEKAFGYYSEDLVQPITIDEYQQATNTSEIPAPGEMLLTPTGTLTVKDVNATHILLDANSPLAGQTMIFDVTVTSIEKGQESVSDIEGLSTGNDL